MGKPIKPKKVKNVLTDKKRSRTIPPEISDKVKIRHHFECAWCGIKHTERHHILYFGKGGEHTEENLILLCPTCHTEVHSKNSKISVNDLYNRKSTHLLADRFSGGLQLDFSEKKIRLGSGIVETLNGILKFGDETVIKIDKIEDEYYLSCRFYSKAGDLIFWMSKNRYWTIPDFTVITNGTSIEIRSKTSDKNFLKLWQDGKVVSMECSNYYNGKVFSATSSGVSVGNGNKILTFQGEGTLKFIGRDDDTSLFNM